MLPCLLPRRGDVALRALSAALLALLVVAAWPATAGALTVTDPDFWKATAARRATVNRFVYDQSPQPIPSSYDSVEEAEGILRSQQSGLSPDNPAARALWQRIRTLTVKEALSTRVGAAGTIGLAVFTGYVGVRIGSGIYQKYFEVKTPPPTPWNPSWPQSIRFLTEGAPIYEGLSMPYDGWAWEWRPTGWASGRNFWVTPTENGTAEACPSDANPPDVPDNFELVDGTPHPNCNSYYNGGGNGGVGHAATLRENQLGAGSPIEDYSGQSYDYWFPTPPEPAQATVEAGIETELGNVENAQLRQWLNYALRSPGERNPVGNEVNVPKPTVAPGEPGEDFADELDELGLTKIKFKVLSDQDFDPDYDEGAVVDVSPEPGTSVEPDEEITVTVNRTEERANNQECDRGAHQLPGLPSDATGWSEKDTFDGHDPDQAMTATTVPLRWGTETWGYRHIAQKHGWDHAQDRSDTQTALLADLAPAPDQPGSWQFYYFYLTPSRLPCTRRVVARFNIRSEETMKMGIITSFAHPGWYRKSDFPG